MDRTVGSDPFRSAKRGRHSDFLQYSIAGRARASEIAERGGTTMKKAPPEGGALTEALLGFLEHEP